jgi:hypothetical protein
LGNPIFKDPPALAANFKDAVQADVVQRLAGVASNHNYTAIADMDHRSASAYTLVSKEQTLAAFKGVGVKHIALEALDVSDQPILDAHARGEISDQTISYYFQNMKVLNTESDYGSDDKTHNNALADLVVSAKKQGIAVHGINAYEGIPFKEDKEAFLADTAKMKLNLLTAIDRNPDFEKMDRKEQARFVRQNLEDQGYSSDKLEDHITNLGYGDTPPKGFLQSMTKENWIERFNGDEHVALRTIMQTQGEKTVVIYGAQHLLRPGYDLDGLLPNSASVELFDDKKKFERDILPGQEQAMSQLGFTLQDRGDFSFDIKSGIWADDAGNQVRLGIQPDNQNVPAPERQNTINAPGRKF